jgi:hypothetical protein
LFGLTAALLAADTVIMTSVVVDSIHLEVYLEGAAYPPSGLHPLDEQGD